MGQAHLPGMDKDSTDPLERKFFAFHAAHPEVYAGIVKEALRLKDRGVLKCGVRLPYELVRVLRGAQCHMPNVYCPLYARLIMRDEPRLKEWFIVCRRRNVAAGSVLGD